jgi:hypothetical protein
MNVSWISETHGLAAVGSLSEGAMEEGNVGLNELIISRHVSYE